MVKKIFFLILILCLSLNTQSVYAQDSDGDGTPNNLDQDEDNDGIPDRLDGCSTIDIANTIGEGIPIVNNSTYTLEETNVTYTHTGVSIFYGYVAGNQGDAIRMQGPTSGNKQLEANFSKPVENLTFKLTDFDSNEVVTVNAFNEFNTLISLTTTNVPFTGTYVNRSGNVFNSNTNAQDSDGDDDADDVRGAAYLYFPGKVKRIVVIANINLNSSVRLTEFKYCLKDFDNDGVLDFRDLDSDNDGIPDIVEAGGVDTDGNGIVDNITDFNSNGIPDIYDFRCTNGGVAVGNATSISSSSNTTNASNALGVANLTYASINSNGTLSLGFSDVIPSGNNITIKHQRLSGTGQISFTIQRSSNGTVYSNTQTFTTSFNGANAVLSYLLIGGDTQFIRITNLSTQSLGIDYAKYNFGANSNCNGTMGQQILNLNIDQDGLIDAQDLDSDGDGIYDIIESGGIDSNNDGIADGFIDTDLDGFNDNFDGDVGNDGVSENSTNAILLTGTDTNNDGIPDSYINANADNSGFPNPYDIDSDNDGIPDNIEAQPTVGYIIPAVAVNVFGIDNAYIGGLSPIDTDGDAIPDYLDNDTDGDTTPDIQENGDVNILAGIDTDDDGLDNNFDSNNLTFDVNDEVLTGTIADLTASFGDSDGDLALGGDLDYRDLFNINPPGPTSIDFDGIDDYVEASNSVINGLSEYTVSLWVKYNGPTLDTDDDVFVFGQKDVFEISIGTWSTPFNPTYNNVRGKVFYNNSQSGVQTGWRFTKSDWTHISVVVRQNGANVETKVFRNGFASSGVATLPGTLSNNSNPLRMGIINGINNYEYNFTGWMDEVKIFNKALTDDQVQRMVFQEIEENVGNIKGKIIDKDITDAVTNNRIPWADLITYYPMNSIVDKDLLDESSYSNDAILYNITTILPQTAPMPFETVADGDWTAESTWLYGDVWDIENLPAFNIPTQSHEPWSIVQIHNDVTTSNSHRSLGLFIDAGRELLVNGDNSISNSWYLRLDGTLNLQDDSQLIQGPYSDLVTSALGNILRRQEGTNNVFRYNYWSSPVGSLLATTLTNNNGSDNNDNNTPFNVSMIKNGSDNSFQFTTAYDEVGKISSHWLFTFQNGYNYYFWNSIDENTLINPGVGYTQKGTGNGNIGDDQQYIYNGKPNNGTIVLDGIDTGGNGSVQDESLTNYFVGNPYPSAIDARIFITENDPANGGHIYGTVYVWEQWSGDTHYLEEYEGGYGTINLTTTEQAYQWNEPTQQNGVKKPTFYIPVAQGFFTEVLSTGDIKFKNSQRAFILEAPDNGNPNNGSIFFRNSNQNSPITITNNESEMSLIRFEFKVADVASRRFVLGFSDNTTDDFDYGYDGRTIDPQEEDLNSSLNGEKMIIQAYAPITEDKVVDLVFNSSGTYNYSIEIIDLQNIAEDQVIYLRDNLTDTYHDLRSEQAYGFTSNEGEFTGRFDVIFQTPDTLSNDEFEANNLLIYVNNPEQKLFVKGLTAEAKNLTITNMLGQTIMSLNKVSIQRLENGLNLSNLSTGVYMVSLKTNNNISIDKKVIIE